MDGRSALFGREAERALLSDALERAREGHGSLLLLSGEAGVGKTRLAEEVAAASVPIASPAQMAGLAWTRAA